MMDQICHQFLHVFSVNLGVILNIDFAEVFKVMYARGVSKMFTEIKAIKDSFYFVFCLLQSYASQFWQ